MTACKDNIYAISARRHHQMAFLTSSLSRLIPDCGSHTTRTLTTGCPVEVASLHHLFFLELTAVPSEPKHNNFCMKLSIPIINENEFFIHFNILQEPASQRSKRSIYVICMLTLSVPVVKIISGEHNND